MVREPNPFGAWLKEHLERAGLSQADLMRTADVSSGTVSYWVNGHRVPEPDSCAAIARALGLHPDEVLAAAGHRPLSQSLEIYEVDRILQETVVLSARAREIRDRLKGGFVRVRRGPRVPADFVRWSVSEEKQEMVDVPVADLAGRPPQQVFVVDASGDCLAGRKIFDGALVLCERLSVGAMPRNGDIVVIRIGDEYSLKVWWLERDWVELRDGQDQVVKRFSIASEFAVIGVAFSVLGYPLH